MAPASNVQTVDSQADDVTTAILSPNSEQLPQQTNNNSCNVIDISDDEISIETPSKKTRKRRLSGANVELIDLTESSPSTSNINGRVLPHLLPANSSSQNRQTRSNLPIQPAVQIVHRPPPPPPPPVGPRCPVCLETFESVSSFLNIVKGFVFTNFYLQLTKPPSMKKILSTKCGHLFCEPCLKESLRLNMKTCPKCRIKIGPKSFHPVFL